MGFIDMMVMMWKEFSIIGKLGLIAALTFLAAGLLLVNLLNYHHWVEGGIVERIFVVTTTAFELGVLYQFVVMISTMERAPRAKD
jgi:hypothetical protein